MSGLQVAILLGAIAGTGLAGMLYALVPAQPDLRDVLTRLSPPARRPRTTATPGPAAAPGVEERLGIWAQRTLPARLLGLPPQQDLNVLRMSAAQFYGQKITYAFVGLTLPGIVSAFLRLIGLPVPVVVPIAGTLVLAAVLFMMPSRDIRTLAQEARTDFSRALSAYIELCALERNSGAGASIALANAAGVGESWAFRRIGAELARSRYTGQPPWDALDQLADDLGVPELNEIADIMRIANDETAEVYRQLRARSTALRTALLNAELEQANQVEVRMLVPGAFTGVVFFALLITPSLMRMLAS